MKTTFGLNRIFKSHEEAKFAVKLSIDACKTKRPHLSCGYLTLIEAHYAEVLVEKKWTNNRTERFTIRLPASIKEEDPTFNKINEH